MGKPLFENVGRDLKTLSNGIYMYTMVGYGLAAFAVCAGSCALLNEYTTIGILGLLVGIGIAVIGHFKAKLSVIKLYAYGELVDRVIAIDGYMSGTGKSEGKGKRKVTPVSVKVDTPATKRDSDGSWTCVFCDHKNRAGADWCENCGVEAVFE